VNEMGAGSGNWGRGEGPRLNATGDNVAWGRGMGSCCLHLWNGNSG
jgi:hypothetical protein